MRVGQKVDHGAFLIFAYTVSPPRAQRVQRWRLHECDYPWSFAQAFMTAPSLIQKTITSSIWTKMVSIRPQIHPILTPRSLRASCSLR